MKFFDLTRQYKLTKGKIDAAIKKVLAEGVFIDGKEVEKIEKKIAKFCEVKYATGVNSGTDSLYLALKALGVRKGNEVITTPFTFIATVEAIANLGAKPVFVDIDPGTFNIDPSKIEEKISRNTKVILPVHLFGQMAEMDKISKLANDHKLFIVEDAAQAMGAEYKRKKAGSFGDFSCLSFFPTKNLGAFGDAGMILTNKKKLSNEVKLLRAHGSSFKDKYLNLLLGTNSRLDSIQAAILGVKINYLNKWNKERIKKAEYYSKSLENVGDIIIPRIAPDRNHIFNQYTIRTKKRDKLLNFLKRKDVPAMIYYSLPLHLQPALSYLEHKKGDFPEAEQVAKEVLSLPIYPELFQKEQEIIIREIKNFFK